MRLDCQPGVGSWRQDCTAVFQGNELGREYEHPPLPVSIHLTVGPKLLNDYSACRTTVVEFPIRSATCLTHLSVEERGWISVVLPIRREIPGHVISTLVPAVPQSVPPPCRPISMESPLSSIARPSSAQARVAACSDQFRSVRWCRW